MSANPTLFTIQQKLILDQLRHTRGAVLPMERLIWAVYGGRLDGGPDNPVRVVYVQVSRLREKLEPHGIALLTIGAGRGTEGYMIDPAHLDKLEALLSSTRELAIELARTRLNPV